MQANRSNDKLGKLPLQSASSPAASGVPEGLELSNFAASVSFRPKMRSYPGDLEQEFKFAGRVLAQYYGVSTDVAATFLELSTGNISPASMFSKWWREQAKFELVTREFEGKIKDFEGWLAQVRADPIGKRLLDEPFPVEQSVARLKEVGAPDGMPLPEEFGEEGTVDLVPGEFDLIEVASVRSRLEKYPDNKVVDFRALVELHRRIFAASGSAGVKFYRQLFEAQFIELEQIPPILLENSGFLAYAIGSRDGAEMVLEELREASSFLATKSKASGVLELLSLVSLQGGSIRERFSELRGAAEALTQNHKDRQAVVELVKAAAPDDRETLLVALRDAPEILLAFQRLRRHQLAPKDFSSFFLNHGDAISSGGRGPLKGILFESASPFSPLLIVALIQEPLTPSFFTEPTLGGAVDKFITQCAPHPEAHRIAPYYIKFAINCDPVKLAFVEVSLRESIVVRDLNQFLKRVDDAPSEILAASLRASTDSLIIRHVLEDGRADIRKVPSPIRATGTKRSWIDHLCADVEAMGCSVAQLLGIIGKLSEQHTGFLRNLWIRSPLGLPLFLDHATRYSENALFQLMLKDVELSKGYIESLKTPDFDFARLHQLLSEKHSGLAYRALYECICPSSRDPIKAERKSFLAPVDIRPEQTSLTATYGRIFVCGGDYRGAKGARISNALPEFPKVGIHLFDESRPAFSPGMIQGTDIVFWVSGSNSHSAYWRTKARCKNTGATFVHVSETGYKPLVACIRKEFGLNPSID